ncbi:ubiquinol-cytochrome C chaperone family protein [Roseibium algae]|uniref:Ubiquinol-cytochrome C chaperone family protein n=1 Tax=Roseibium algae TaxID=3123038 RepID=A0ABU8TJ69_9HYPH
MLFGLFRRKTRDSELKVYSQIVAQARQTAFYTAFKVPDTIDSRFDMIVLHAVLLFRRLRGEGAEISRFSQDVFDLFFHDMDATLRELGVSDTRVPKKIKAMGEAFYGRADAYMPHIDGKDVGELAIALKRNVYAQTEEPTEEKALARYMIAAAEALEAQLVEKIIAAEMVFPDLVQFVGKEDENGN